MSTRDELEVLIAKLERAIQKHENTLEQLRFALENARSMLSVATLLDEDEPVQQPSRVRTTSSTLDAPNRLRELSSESSRESSSELTRDALSKLTREKEGKIGLRRAILMTINTQTGKFTAPEIADALVKKYPGQFSNAQKGSVSSIISKIARQGGIIQQVEPGAGSRPPTYIRAQ